MKSYLQGMITGGVLVFATIVFMGANKEGEVGRYTFHESISMSKDHYTDSRTVWDTKLGIGINMQYHDLDQEYKYIPITYKKLVELTKEQYKK